MGLLFNCVIWDLVAILATLAVGLYTFVKWKFSYWKRRNVPFAKPTFPFGTSENPTARTQYIGMRVKKRYDEFKAQGYKHGGVYMFTSPTYLPIDPEYIKNIMSKDFRYFTDRGTYANEKTDPLSGHLFNLEGPKWKGLRTKLTPTFTSGKMKLMFPTLVECANQLKVAVEELHQKELPIDIKEISGCFTTDVIGSCAFGLECNSFSNPDSDFRKYGKKMFSSTTQARSLGALIAMANQDLARLLGVSITPKDVETFFIDVVKRTVEYRKKENVVRKDFLQLLIDLRDEAEKAEESFTIEEMAAQAFVFFLAGFETSSSAMSFCLFELARRPDIQKKVREELVPVLEKHGGQITYDAIMDLKYMNQVVDETLRKYPPASMIPRMCVEDYPIPEANVVIEKGTRILIPVFALHYDPEFYPDPEEFDPDRFSEDNKSRRHAFTYLPFGEGPRICIGLRFGLMQTKVGLATLLKNYSFSVSDKTKVPLEIDPNNFIPTTKDGIWLDIHELNV